MADTLLEARIKYRVAGDYAENVFHWDVNAAGTNDYVLATRLFAGIIAVAGPPTWMTTLLAMMTNDVFISTIATRVIRPVGGNRYAQGFQTTGRVGSVASEIYTDETAYVINWMSLTEPAKMGRSFIPGIPISFVTAGRFLSGGVTAANNFANKHVAGITNGGSTFTPVIYRQVGHTWRPIADGFLGPNIGQMSQRGMGE